MQLTWIYFGAQGNYVADIECPRGVVTSLKAETLGELRSKVMSQLPDDDQQDLADALFTEFMAGQITNAIVTLERMRANLSRIAA